MKIIVQILIVLCLCHSIAYPQETVENKSSAKVVFKVADVLQSNMVIQQNKPLKVWGRAEAGKWVIVKADWIPTPVTVIAGDNNTFMAIIIVPEVKSGDFTKHKLEVSTEDEKVILENVLIGDLWLCSGQSNMQFSMKEALNSINDVSEANYPNIRLLNVALNFSSEKIDDLKGHWQECSPTTVKDFSAVGYYFGHELYQTLNIPIGLIFSGIGASAAQAYVPQETLEKDTMLNRVYLKPYLNSPKSKEKIDGGFSFEKVTRPMLLYNAMIYPLTNLSIKGICWYQGESNRLECNSFTQMMYALIESWRSAFGQGSLPFYYVQIAPFFYDQENPQLAECAFFREAQDNIAKLNNTGEVTTMDVGEMKNIHPKNKKPVGIRLAKMALNRSYGMLQVAYQGPQYAYAEFKKNRAIIHFAPETVSSGLSTNDGKEPAHFFMAGKDQHFYPSTATISGNTVIVSSSKVKDPVAIRYAFTNYPITNFQNSAGFAAFPFRTDNWQ